MGAKTGITWCDAKKTCNGPCRTSKPLTAFCKDAWRPDGHSDWCRECRNARARSRYSPRGRPERSGPPPAAPRDGDKKQARRRINVLVRTGRLPHPSTLPCVDCGHVGGEGTRRHEYDHHLGYGVAHHLDVVPVCTRCHADREATRGVRFRAKQRSGPRAGMLDGVPEDLLIQEFPQ